MHIHLRYAHRKDNGVANIAGDVLFRLRRIAHSLKLSDVKSSVKGKLKNWFGGNTYFKIRTKMG